MGAEKDKTAKSLPFSLRSQALSDTLQTPTTE